MILLINYRMKENDVVGVVILTPYIRMGGEAMDVVTA